MRRSFTASLLLALGPVACMDRAVPTEPAVREPSLAIADAPRGYDIFLNKEDNCEKVVLKA